MKSSPPELALSRIPLNRLLRRQGAFGGQPAKQGVHSLGRQLRPTVKPPRQDRHIRANDELNHKFARYRRGIPTGGLTELAPHQVGQYLTNRSQGDGATATADQRTIVSAPFIAGTDYL